MTSRAALALALDLDDLDRLRPVVAQWRALGGDSERFGAMIAECLDSLPAARATARNAALVDLVGTYAGKPWQAANAAATALRRYETTVWKRRDRNFASPPLEYESQPQKLALFAVMSNGGSVGAKRISQIVASHCTKTAIDGNLTPACGFHGKRSRNSLNQTEAETLNAMTRPNDQAFLDALRAAPVGREIVKAETARTVAERAKLVDALRALDAKAPGDFAKLDKAVSVEVANVRAAEIALKAANDKLRAANFAKSGAVLAYDVERRRLEEALRASPAATLIDEFLRDMRDELDATRKRHDGGYLPIVADLRGVVGMISFGNKESVQRRLNAIHAAIEAAEALRLVADQTGLVEKLAALRAGLPEIAPAKFPDVALALEELQREKMAARK